jgi:hypothetical protein
MLNKMIASWPIVKLAFLPRMESVIVTKLQDANTALEEKLERILLNINKHRSQAILACTQAIELYDACVLENSDATEDELQQGAKIRLKIKALKFTATKSDAKIDNHIGNLRYATMALEAIQNDLLEKTKLTEDETLNFNNEIATAKLIKADSKKAKKTKNKTDVQNYADLLASINNTLLQRMPKVESSETKINLDVVTGDTGAEAEEQETMSHESSEEEIFEETTSTMSGEREDHTAAIPAPLANPNEIDLDLIMMNQDEDQPTQSDVVDAQPEEDVVVDAQPEEDVVIDAQPEEDVVVDAQPEEDVVVDAQPEEDVVVDAQPEEDVVVDAQPDVVANNVFQNELAKLRAVTFRNDSIATDVETLLGQIAAVDAQDQTSLIDPMKKLYEYFAVLSETAADENNVDAVSAQTKRRNDAHDAFVASVQPLLAHDNALVKNIGIGLLSVAGVLLAATAVAIGLGAAAIVVLPTAAIASLAVATVSFSAAGFGTFFGAPRIPAKLEGTASIALADKINRDDAPHTLVTGMGAGAA